MRDTGIVVTHTAHARSRRPSRADSMEENQWPLEWLEIRPRRRSLLSRFVTRFSLLYRIRATGEFAHGKHARNDAFGHPSYSNYGFSLIPLCNHRCRDRCM